MHSKIMRISPELASDILSSRNNAGRPISRERVRRYLAEMQAGRWEPLSPHGISFSGQDIKTSLLVDGQHRLSALKLFGKALEFYVHFDVPQEYARTMDQGLSRTAAQGLASELSESSYSPRAAPSRLASAARLILELGLSQPKGSNLAIAEFARKNVEILDRYADLGKLYKAGAHAAFAFADLSGFEGVPQAAERLLEMSWNAEDDPMRALARALAAIPGQGARAQKVGFYSCLAALEYVDRGEGLQVARKYDAMPQRVASSIMLRAPDRQQESSLKH